MSQYGCDPTTCLWTVIVCLIIGCVNEKCDHLAVWGYVSKRRAVPLGGGFQEYANCYKSPEQTLFLSVCPYLSLLMYNNILPVFTNLAKTDGNY